MKYKAKIRFLSYADGGRFSPPMSGYKPHIQIGDEFTSCTITPLDVSVEIMEFGIEYDVFLELIYPEVYRDKVTREMEIKLYEGSKLTGTGFFID